MIYVDSSAFLKLVWQEEQSQALDRYLRTHPHGDQLVSSALTIIETRRTVQRWAPDRMAKADLKLGRVISIPITDPLIESASRLPDRMLRSLDAIHLATALMLRDDIDVLVTYDRRMAEVAEASEISTASPG